MRFFMRVSTGTGLAITTSKASIHCLRRNAMKFETLMLQSLFAACLVICVTTLGAMLV
jgi:hypothetical protein